MTRGSKPFRRDKYVPPPLEGYEAILRGWSNHESFDITGGWQPGNLKKINKHFLRHDSLSVIFNYNDDWSNIESMLAIVHGDDIAVGLLQLPMGIALAPFLIMGSIVFHVKRWFWSLNRR